MKPCLLLIDFINDIIHDNGKAPSCSQYVKEYQVVEKANAAITLAHQHHMPVIFIKVGFGAHYYETPKHSPVFSGAPAKQAFKLGEWGTAFHDALNYRPEDDAVVIKPRISPFYATTLEAFLRAQQVDTVILAGVSTNNAVQAAARDAHDRDYAVIVLKDACGAKDHATHDMTITLLGGLAKVINVADLEANL